jgi:antitoxin component of MazEF toxin-antitoxin module
MTKFKAKLRKIGNSQGVIIPKEVITDYQLGDEIELEVITARIEKGQRVITPNPKFVFNPKKGIWENNEENQGSKTSGSSY